MKQAVYRGKFLRHFMTIRFALSMSLSTLLYFANQNDLVYILHQYFLPCLDAEDASPLLDDVDALSCPWLPVSEFKVYFISLNEWVV